MYMCNAFFFAETRRHRRLKPTQRKADRSKRRVVVLGHRGGAAGQFPENSLSAFTTGLKNGADILEMDVHLTVDNEVVVAHDPVFTGIDGVSRQISASTAAEVATFAPAIPMLSAVLERFPSGRFNIDLKVDSLSLVEGVIDLVRRSRAVQRTVIASFIPSILEYARAAGPEFVTSTHPDEVKRMLISHLFRRRPKSPARFIQVPLRHGLVPIVTPRFVDFAHRHGYDVHVWTINEPRDAIRLARIGVDGIVTDDVTAIDTALKYQGYRNTERHNDGAHDD
jgi:glycerophosphoryl diester phosphodiesterase